MEISDFTQEQQDFINEMITTNKTKWKNEELMPLQSELAKYKPIQKTEQEEVLEKREQELKKKEFDLLIKEEGLSDFAAFLDANDEKAMKTKVQELKKVLESRKIDNSFKPEPHKRQDAYMQAEKDGNVTGMISAKLSKIFA